MHLPNTEMEAATLAIPLLHVYAPLSFLYKVVISSVEDVRVTSTLLKILIRVEFMMAAPLGPRQDSVELESLSMHWSVASDVSFNINDVGPFITVETRS